MVISKTEVAEELRARGGSNMFTITWSVFLFGIYPLYLSLVFLSGFCSVKVRLQQLDYKPSLYLATIFFLIVFSVTMGTKLPIEPAWVSSHIFNMSWIAISGVATYVIGTYCRTRRDVSKIDDATTN